MGVALEPTVPEAMIQIPASAITILILQVVEPGIAINLPAKQNRSAAAHYLVIILLPEISAVRYILTSQAV